VGYSGYSSYQAIQAIQAIRDYFKGSNGYFLWLEKTQENLRKNEKKRAFQAKTG